MLKKKPVDVAVGQRLAQMRRKRKLLQRELAKLLRITVRMLRYYERGKVALTVDRIADCARVLGCEPADLLKPPKPVYRDGFKTGQAATRFALTARDQGR